MGVIQNSINQLLGTTTGAVALGKHLQEQKNANEINTAGVAEKLADEEQNYYDLEQEMGKLGKEKELLQEDKIPSEGGGYTFNIFGQDLAPEIEKRTLALNVLDRKRAAKELLINSYKKVIGEKTVAQAIGGKR